MTDELRSYGEGNHTEHHHSATIECCKVKGIRLNYNNSLKINFESIKSLIDDKFGENADKSDNDTVKDKRTIKVHTYTRGCDLRSVQNL
ncbi:hypothetical protein TSAR_011347 [Trichomalopsis sarcophagae]|uniref:Uncharacterized protein n=1 Tax=Trichomalopsis sarcophagae TaxID=543379 RepID=A0A232ELJ2_9HYME|nr:hypothetical protein TSAR_011347 [Trichomalopsis sarcophagae]